jgi:GNAT superfamily N-acetyltransferase
MAPATIRRGLSVEADEIRAVILAANAPFEAILPRDFFRAYLASALDVEGRLAQGAAILVAETAGGLVGTVTHFPDANDEGMPVTLPRGTGGLRATAVHPDHQGFGIGRALVEACAARAISHGARSLALHTAPFMTAAMALYARAGFVRVPELDFAATSFFESRPQEGLEAMAYVRGLTRTPSSGTHAR